MESTYVIGSRRVFMVQLVVFRPVSEGGTPETKCLTLALLLNKMLQSTSKELCGEQTRDGGHKQKNMKIMRMLPCVYRVVCVGKEPAMLRRDSGGRKRSWQDSVWLGV